MILGNNALIRAKTPLGPWYLANGTIAESAVEDYGTDVSPATTYAGNTITAGNAWTVAVRVDSGPGAETLPNLWMSRPGGLRTGVRWQSASIRWNYYSDNTLQVVDGTTAYPAVVMAICNGTNTEFYYNNSLVTTVADAGSLDASIMRWGSDESGGNQWPSILAYVWAGNIALDSTQRATLYASMAA